MKELRFRQVHLDFHTSPHIPSIGAKFDKKQWQDTLKKAHVDSITCFSSCHHGWSYHPTQVGKMHPGLNFNLLRAQMDACHEINVNVPIYLTGGVNNLAAEEHPEWREITAEGKLAGWVSSPLEPGFKKLCFNTPYLDYLCRMIEEAVHLFPDANGVFIDIISQSPCCCKWCMEDMAKEGYDPLNPEDRKQFSRRTLLKYYQRTTAAARSLDPDMPVFHNSGNVTAGNRDILPYFSHLELESLPTGGWGYDHYPMSAAYCRKLDLDFLGMTGKFHTTWGEFGGFKHPNALRYECAAMLAQGSKCSIGDQLHPSGNLDESTYELIGAAYSEVEQKEPWCGHVRSAANVAILSNTAFNPGSTPEGAWAPYGEVGASRLLLESHIHFDALDQEMSFDPYQFLILADDLRISPELKTRLDAFLARGGKLILSGASILRKDEDVPAFDLPCEYAGVNPLFPGYIKAAPEFAPDFVKTPFVMYQPSHRIKVKSGTSLGEIYDPYFNRTYAHFSSHQHTPYQPDPSGYDAGVMTDNILYFAHPVFGLYAGYGNVALKQFVAKAILAFAGRELPVHTNLPSQGRATLMKQEDEKRYVLHLLYVNTINRGSKMEMSGGNVRNATTIEVIEELNPVDNITASVKVPETIRRITLEPQGIELPVQQTDGRYEVKLDRLTCHQMVVFHY